MVTYSGRTMQDKPFIGRDWMALKLKLLCLKVGSRNSRDVKIGADDGAASKVAPRGDQRHKYND